MIDVPKSAWLPREDIDRLKAAGVRAVLVGETLMRSDDISVAIKELLGSID